MFSYESCTVAKQALIYLFPVGLDFLLLPASSAPLFRSTKYKYIQILANKISNSYFTAAFYYNIKSIFVGRLPLRNWIFSRELCKFILFLSNLIFFPSWYFSQVNFLGIFSTYLTWYSSYLTWYFSTFPTERVLRVRTGAPKEFIFNFAWSFRAFTELNFKWILIISSQMESYTNSFGTLREKTQRALAIPVEFIVLRIHCTVLLGKKVLVTN